MFQFNRRRSPPPVSWPMSPRSNGTFSPDSSDMDVDNPPLIFPPKRGYSPYNRSQSEEHILSPCRELLKSAEFSPVSSLFIQNAIIKEKCSPKSVEINIVHIFCYFVHLPPSAPYFLKEGAKVESN